MRIQKTNTARTILALTMLSLLTVSPRGNLTAAPGTLALTLATEGTAQSLVVARRSEPVAPAPKTEPRTQLLELPAVFLRGDADRDGAIDMTDSLYTLSSLFLGTKELRCEDAADANDNGEVELTDAVLVLRYLFAGGAAIPAPFPGCGVDVTSDRLECEGVENCGSETETSRALISVGDDHVVELPPQILEAIPEGAKVRLRRVEGGTTRILEGVASRFSEDSMLIEAVPPPSVVAPQQASTVGQIRLGGSVRAGGGLLAGATTPAFECNPLGCICEGDDDCNDMFGSGICGDGICWEDAAGKVVCICVR